MCNYFQATDKTEFTGFKIVAEKDGKYYSILTGEEYPGKEQDMPVWTSLENMIVKIFNPYVLDGSPDFGYSSEMKGRTAVFVTKKRALKMKREANDMFIEKGIVKKFNIVVIKVKLTKHLLAAKYYEANVFADVFVGRRMEIIEEV